MGDMADEALREFIDGDYEEGLEDYLNSPNKTCRYCGKSGLEWRKYLSTFRLYDVDAKCFHTCQEHSDAVDREYNEMLRRLQCQSVKSARKAQR